MASEQAKNSFQESTSCHTLIGKAPGPHDHFKSRNEQNGLTKASYGQLVDGYGKKFKIPDYTIQQIRDAIPAHCFERSALTSLAYVIRDVFLLVLTFIVFKTYVTPDTIPSWHMRFILWSFYTFLQGLFGIGLWVLGHECGHQAFSESKTLNDTTGWILHSFLLVPYFSWKLTHKQHHALHNNLAKDMQFVPKSREQYGKRTGKAAVSNWEMMEETPLRTVVELIGQQLIGWPRYLLTNDSGNTNYPAGERVNHFDPNSILFRTSDHHLILASDFGLAIMFGVLAYLQYTCGWANIAVWYWIPYFWVNHWLVAIAYLHHSDPSLPKYQPKAWTFARGAAATIDRDFGFIGHHLFHDIIETHVLHHSIPTIPFYHAREATEAMKTVMGEHYRSDTTDGPIGFLKGLWRSARWCQWVEQCEGVDGLDKDVWFPRNSNGLGVPPMVSPAT